MICPLLKKCIILRDNCNVWHRIFKEVNWEICMILLTDHSFVKNFTIKLDHQKKSVQNKSMAAQLNDVVNQERKLLNPNHDIKTVWYNRIQQFTNLTTIIYLWLLCYFKLCTGFNLFLASVQVSNYVQCKQQCSVQTTIYLMRTK